MVYSTWGILMVPSTHSFLSIYQWSNLATFSNTTLQIHTKLDNMTEGCLLISKLKKPDAKAYIDKLSQKNANLSCVLVSISSTETWYYHDLINTPFPVGLVVNLPFINIPPNGTIKGIFMGWDINYNSKYYGAFVSFFNYQYGFRYIGYDLGRLQIIWKVSIWTL